MKVCPKCMRTIHDVDAVYCADDGHELVQRVQHECGFVALPLDKFCPKCGKEIERVNAHA